MNVLFEERASTILYNFLLSIEHNKPFLLPSNICPIVPLTFLKAGKPFEFIDISTDGFCMQPDLVLERLRDRPDAYGGVLYVRTYGAPHSPDDLFREIKEVNRRVIVIDDRCLCIPAFNVEMGPFVDLILYSTGYSKFIDLGYGGFAFMKQVHGYRRHKTAFEQKSLESITSAYKQAVRERMRFVYADSNWLDTSEPRIPFSEYKSLVENMIPATVQLKLNLNRIYAQNLPREIQLRPEQQDWRFNILVPDKEELLDRIFAAGLWASSHYDSLDGVFSDGQSGHAEALSASIVNLFNDRSFDEEKARQVARIVNEHLSEGSINDSQVQSILSN